MLITSVQMYEVYGLHGKTCTLQACFTFVSTSISITIPMSQVHRIFAPKDGIMYESFPLLETSPLHFPA